jgi:hypothetical protein
MPRRIRTLATLAALLVVPSLASAQAQITVPSSPTETASIGWSICALASIA